MEILVEHACDEVLRTGTGADRKLIEDALVLVKLAQLRLKRLEKRDHLHGLRRLPDVPDLHVQEVPRLDVAPVLREAGIRDRGHDLREEVLLGLVLLLLEGDGGAVADPGLSEVADPDDALARRV